MMEDEEEPIMDANNITADAFSHVPSSQRENVDVIFTSEKVDESDELVNGINKWTINNSGYGWNKATTSDAQGNLTSDPDTVTYTSNGILDQNLLSGRTIGEVYALPTPTNPTIIFTSQTLLTHAVKEIFMDATSGNTWTSRNPRWIIRTGVYGSIPISTPIQNGMSKYSTPYFSEISGTRGTRTRIYIADTAPPCGLNVSRDINDIQKSATPGLRKSNKLDTFIDRQFTNNLVAPPILTEVLCDKL